MVDIMLAFEMLKFLKNAYMYKSYVRTCTYMYKSCMLWAMVLKTQNQLMQGLRKENPHPNAP